MQQIFLKNPSGSSEILVGSGLSARISDLEPPPVLLVDEHVLCQHDDLFGKHQCISVPSGETYKTLQTVENLQRELIKAGADRSSLLVGVGGGLATDIAGFVASTYLRELRFGFISSTLLGQVDASIGGKNGVNLDGYKNMIGTIRQPAFVWCDLDLLYTLARKEYISGIAEVIKYGAIMDAPLIPYLEEHMASILDQDPAILEEVLGRSVRAKVSIVEQDEKEGGIRRLLNFGHTLGHAIERESRLLHGYAISIGMVLASRLSVNLGMLPAADAQRMEDLIGLAGLPVELDLDMEVIWDNLLKDKKKSGGSIHFIVLEALGRAVERTFSLDELKPMINDLC